MTTASLRIHAHTGQTSLHARVLRLACMLRHECTIRGAWMLRGTWMLRGAWMLRLACVLLLAVVCASCREEGAHLPGIAGRVVKVKDGDTIVLLVNNTEVTVRLAGVDCPEKRQAFGQKAKQFTSDACFGKDVHMVGSTTDRYGRTVAEILLPDGRSLNKELVRNGMAWWYERYSHDQELHALQEQAQEKRAGLWSDPNPVPPWQFRKGRRG